MSELQDPEIFQSVLDSLLTGIYVADGKGKIVFWNREAERITGHLRHEVIGRSGEKSILAQCNDKTCSGGAENCSLDDVQKEGKPKELRVALHHKQGHSVPVLLRLTPIRTCHSSINYVAGTFDELRPMTDQRRNRRSPIPQSCLDKTGVSNRGFTQFHLRESLAGLAEYQIPFSILCIELEQFDRLRTAYGREASEAIARVVAETLRDSLRPDDFVGRWADDQFLTILSNCGAQGVGNAAARIHKAVANSGIQWWGDWLKASTLLGYATAQAGDTIQSLVQRAQPREKRLANAWAAGGGTSSTPEPRGS